MTRTTARELALRLCFSLSESGEGPEELLETVFDPEYYETLKSEDEIFAEYPDEAQMRYIKRLVAGVGEHSYELDGYIEKYARGWKFARISRTAVAILKTAMYEVMYMSDEVPVGAAVNEAVELAKKYEEPETVPFINGILGSFSREEAADK